MQAFNNHALPDSDSGPVCVGMHRGGHREEDRRDRTGGGVMRSDEDRRDKGCLEKGGRISNMRKYETRKKKPNTETT